MSIPVVTTEQVPIRSNDKSHSLGIVAAEAWADNADYVEAVRAVEEKLSKAAETLGARAVVAARFDCIECGVTCHVVGTGTAVVFVTATGHPLDY